MLKSTLHSVCHCQRYLEVRVGLLKTTPLRLQSTIANLRSNRTAYISKMTTAIEQPCHRAKFSSTTSSAPHFYGDVSDKQSNPIDNNTHLSIDEQYEETIKVLNTLQSNADTIRRSIALNNKQMPLDDMYKYFARSGLNLDEIETRLSFIHVSGTKGKGSTCALTESILRAYGLKTGFFSSPHLVAVTERIRINGQPIDRAVFVQAFWRVYRRLVEHKQTPTDMPPYFKFLTILCMHIFLEQQVDVVVLEVGIGGEYDCTNIIRNTKTVGITSLGLEHTQLLGHTLPEIAWQKAGIIKPNADVYTSVTQSECLDVIRQRASERHAFVHSVPAYTSYFRDAKTTTLLAGLNSVTQLNGSLAIQLAYDWLRKRRPMLLHGDSTTTADDGGDTVLSEQVLHGLTQCVWPGRCQVLQLPKLNIHLDGAHTPESMCVCSSWFRGACGGSGNPKVLIFNTTGDRDARKLLDTLHREHEFDCVCFVPNISAGCANRGDLQSVYGISEQIKRTKIHAGYWHLLCTEADETDNSHLFSSILDAIDFVDKRYALPQQQVDVLVTGSLHLVGASLAAFDEFQQRGAV